MEDYISENDNTIKLKKVMSYLCYLCAATSKLKRQILTTAFVWY